MSYFNCNVCNKRIVKSHNFIYCSKCGYDIRLNYNDIIDRLATKVLHEHYWIGVYSWPLEPLTHIYAGVEGRQMISLPYAIAPKIEDNIIHYKEFLVKIKNILVLT